MPPSRPEPSNKLGRGAYKSAEAPGPLIAKAARKLQLEFEPSDHRSTSDNQYDGESSYADFSDTDSDVVQRPLNRGMYPMHVVVYIEPRNTSRRET